MTASEDNVRSSAAVTYLTDAKCARRPNFTVLTNALAEKVRFEGVRSRRRYSCR